MTVEIRMDLNQAESLRGEMRTLADQLARGLYALDSETKLSLAEWVEEARDAFKDTTDQWLKQAQTMYKDLQAADTVLAAAMNAYASTTRSITQMWAGS